MARPFGGFKSMLTRRAALATPLVLPAVAGLSTLTQAATGFPAGFVWGAAASAPQTEGSAGRGQSIWDVFAAQPGKIKDGSNLVIGTGFETRYPQDLDLAAQAGLNAFRFSIAWPRVQPTGSGPVNANGLGLYDRMVDAMLERRLEPWPTLFHWDLPAALPGGWLNRDTAYHLADYAVIVGRKLGDRVRAFMVLNEPGVVAILGHALGQHAPGLASREAFAAAMHHQNLAQGLAFAALRAALPPRTKLGSALSLQPVQPAQPGAAADEAARAWDDAWNRGFLDPLFGRPYPARFLPALEALVKPNDMGTIGARPDFLGVNYYSRMHMVPAPGSVLGATFGASPAGLGHTGLGWPIQPDGLLEQLRKLRDEYGNPDMLITENGASFADPAPSEGEVADPARIAFLRGHLLAAAQACREGCALRGYFSWTLTDNFEWAEGFGPKFGMIQVDRTTLARTPKQSLAWLGRCARANAVI
jgi:beta-glucosidase